MNIHRLAQLKGIPRIYSFLLKLGLTKSMAKHYTSGKYKMIKLHDLEQMCLALHCTPNDLLLYTQSDKDAALPPNHPLNDLRHLHTEMNIAPLLMNANKDKLAQIKEILQKEG